VPRATDEKAARRAALGFELEQRRRESERRKEEAAREKERERRQQAIAEAQAAFEKGKREHKRRIASIEAEPAAQSKNGRKPKRLVGRSKKRRWKRQCLSQIKSGHIGGVARRELGGKECPRLVRRRARPVHLSPR
jgi:hypothetical protein